MTKEKETKQYRNVKCWTNYKTVKEIFELIENGEFEDKELVEYEVNRVAE